MNREEYDAVVVGAGPAGTSAAAVLGEAGRSVLLIDRSGFPRAKTCGDGITFKCREPLRRLGRWEAFLDRRPFRTLGYSLCFSDHSRLMLRPPPDDEKAAIFIIRRFDFDALLLEGALAHRSVRFRPKTAARHLIREHRDGREVVVGVEAEDESGPVECRACLTIDATGANSSLAVQAGAGNRDPKRCAFAVRGYYRDVRGLDDAIEIYFDKRILPGYYWVFPTSETTANVGCGTFQHIVEDRKLDLRAILEEFRTTHPVASKKLGGATLEGPMQGGKIPLGIDAEAPRARDGLLLLGDAGAFVDPITAEGISFAMTSGIHAGEAGAEAMARGDCSAEALRPFDVRWKEEFAAKFANAAFLADGLPRSAFLGYVHDRLARSPRLEAAEADRGLQYELMVKLKCMMKAV